MQYLNIEYSLYSLKSTQIIEVNSRVFKLRNSGLRLLRKVHGHFNTLKRQLTCLWALPLNQARHACSRVLYRRAFFVAKFLTLPHSECFIRKKYMLCGVVIYMKLYMLSNTIITLCTFVTKEIVYYILFIKITDP